MKKVNTFAATLFLAAASVAVAAGSFQIRYKVTAEPVPYDAQLIDKQAEHDEKAEPKWTVSDVKQLIVKEVWANADGSLQVRNSIMGEQTFDGASGKISDPLAFQPAKIEYGITPRGAYTAAPSITDPVALLAPELPDEAVAPGHKWTTEQPVADLGGATLTVNHEFVAVETDQGRPCAIIVSEAEGKFKLPDGQVGMVLRGALRSSISLTDGILIASTGNSSTTIKKAGENGKPALLTRRETVKMLRRRENL